MRSQHQQIARELSRMHPVDRALAKAIRLGRLDGSTVALRDLMSRALINAATAAKRFER